MNTRILYLISNMRVSNGVTSVIMNYVRNLQGDDFQLDFISLYNRESPYIEEIKGKGCNLWVLPIRKEKIDFIDSYKMMSTILKTGNYDIVHSHLTGKYSVMLMKLAKHYHVPCRVLHSHNPRDMHNIKNMLRSLVYDNLNVHLSNFYIACSESAGKSIFKKKKFTVIKNTIEIEKYLYSSEARIRGRKELGISRDIIVIGTVCRQTYQKNPYFLVDIFDEFHKLKPDSVLIWIGTGELMNSIQEYVNKKELNQYIQFIGNRSDMKEMYSSMDIFLLPSKYEGLGIVLLEAQTCGLLSFTSTEVPEDVKITDHFYQISLKESPNLWAKKMNDLYENHKNLNRTHNIREIEQKGYSTKDNQELYLYYKQIMNETIR